MWSGIADYRREMDWHEKGPTGFLVCEIETTSERSIFRAQFIECLTERVLYSMEREKPLISDSVINSVVE
jgi:phage-related protein